MRASHTTLMVLWHPAGSQSGQPSLDESEGLKSDYVTKKKVNANLQDLCHVFNV